MRRSIEEGGGLVEEVVEVVDEDSSTTSATSTTSILLPPSSPREIHPKSKSSDHTLTHSYIYPFVLSSIIINIYES